MAAKEADIERRKRDVYEREQYVAAHDQAAHMFVAPVRAMHKLRRRLHARAPRWLIAAKRKLFGVAGSKPNTTRPTKT